MQLNQLILTFIGFLLCSNLTFAGLSNDTDIPYAVSVADSIELEIVGGTARRCGETCYDVIVRNFTEVNTMQFSINWDPRMLEFVQVIQRVSPADLWMFRISQHLNVQRSNGVMRCTWDDTRGNNNTLPDGTVLFSICYKAIGPAGDQTQIRFSNVPILIEFTNGDTGEEYDHKEINKDILINDAINLCVQSYVCPTSTNTGSITITADGGVLDYTVKSVQLGDQTITSQGGSVTYSNLLPGDYNFTISDRSGIGKDTSFILTVKAVDQVIIGIKTMSLPACDYATSGRGGHINITIDGGAGDPDSFAINWQPGNYFGTKYLGRLAPDVYTVTVIDSLGCESSMSIDLTTAFPKLDVNVLQNSACANSMDGIVEAKTIDGKRFPGNSYKYTWSKGVADCDLCQNSTNSNIDGTNQWVIVEDALGCMDTAYFDVPYDNELILSNVEITNNICPGDSNGSFIATATNNNTDAGFYTFSLTDINQLNINGGVTVTNVYSSPQLPSGKYILETTHDNGCTTIDTIEILSPPDIEINVVAIDTTTSCAGNYDAFIEVNGSGGNGGPYTYLWSTGDIGNKIDELPPFTYSVTITDNRGCKEERAFEVTGAQGPEIDGFTDTEHIKCKGDNTGKATVIVTEGNSKITSYKWSNGDNTNSVKDLKAGTYYVTVEDENGCTDVDSIEITEPIDGFELDSFSILNPECPDDVNGRITLTIKGGSAPYTYEWSDGSTASILNNVGAGKYSVTITDATDVCPSIIQEFTLIDPPHINISLIDSSMVSCNNNTTCDAIWEATASGGTDPSLLYNFIWESGTDLGTDRSRRTDICQGQQILIVTNGNCADTAFFNVGAPEKIKITENAFHQDVTCFGDSNGIARLEFSGGQEPYDVIWQDGNTQDPIRNDLKAGTYRVFIRDANDCLVRDSFQIGQPDEFIVTTIDNVIKNPRCNGSDDGRIAIKFEGGNSGRRTVDWSPNVIGDSLLQNLAAGTYTVIAMDSKGCEDSLSITLSEPPVINFEMPLPDPPNCFGEQVPLTIISANGGAGPDYSYTINTGARHDINEIVDLFAGNYLISVYDKDGCSIDSSIVITSPKEIVVTFEEDEIELELGDSVEVCLTSILEPGDIVTWSPEAKITNPDGSCIIVDASDNITYTATIRNINGCEESAELRIHIVNRGRVYIPNTFAPGSVNNIFKVFTGIGVESIDFMKIYNRWGGLVYHQENIQPELDGWNGRTQNSGKNEPAGVYVYLIQVTYKNGDTHLFRSDITLIR